MSGSCLIFFLSAFWLFCRCGGKDLADPALRPRVVGVIPIGVFGPEIGSNKPLKAPADIAVNDRGEIFIADYGNDRVVKLDPNGDFMAECGGSGSQAESMKGPVSLAIDNVSNVYVIDSGNSRVMIFDFRLNHISSQTGFWRGQLISFRYLTAIKISRGGYIYLGDDGLGGCYKLDPFFGYVNSFGEVGSHLEIGYPAGIALASDSRIVVADRLRRKIVVFDDFGTPIAAYDTRLAQAPNSVGVAPNGIIWTIDKSGLNGLDRRGNVIVTWSGVDFGASLSLSAVCPSGDTLLYLADAGLSRILLLKPLYGD